MKLPPRRAPLRLISSLAMALCPLWACGPTHTPDTVSQTNPNSALDQLVASPPWPQGRVDEAIATWSSSVQAAPVAAPERLGMLMLDDATYPHMPASEYGRRVLGGQPPAGEIGARVTTHRRLLRRAPVAEIQVDGRAIVRFETTRPIGGAGLYFGTRVPADPFRQARYRRHTSTLESSEDGLSHTIVADIPRLLRERYDVGGTLESGQGLFTFRLEVLDPDSGDARVFDGQARFQCTELGCGEGNAFVQSPAFPIGPFVDLIATDSVTLSARTDVPTHTALLVVCPRGRVRMVTSTSPAREHIFEVNALTPDTRYGYQLWSMDSAGRTSQTRIAAFRTAVEPHQPFTFAALSDSRSGHGAADERYGGTNRRVLSALLLESLRHDSRFAIFVGDLVDGGGTSPSSLRFELFAWQQAVSPFTPWLPIYEVMGNHESLVDLWEPGWATARLGPDGPEGIFAQTFVNPTNGPTPARAEAPTYLENTYSFDYGSAHLSVINTNYWYRSHPDRDDHPAHDRGQREGWVNDETMRWLAQDLADARARGQRHLFVFTHEPGFPNGGHSHDAMYWRGESPEVLARRDELFRLMAEHGVTAIVHGDEHNYSRLRVDHTLVDGMTRPLWQLTSGGAGAPYYAQERSLPWSDQVATFEPRQHLLLFDVTPSRVQLRVISITGETIERLGLSDAP